MICKFFALIAILINLLFAVTAVATVIKEDLGTVGETYPIVEPDILAELKKQALRNQPTREEIVQRAKTYQPHNLQQLPRAAQDRTFPVDMTYTFKNDVLDGNGKIIYPRGYTFNPLDYYSFPGGMVVIDGSDPKQIKWFRKSPYFENHQARLLISGGYAYDLVKQFQRPVFYLTDTIAGRLQLTAVPAVVVQRGKKLQVREVYIDPIDPAQRGGGEKE